MSGKAIGLTTPISGPMICVNNFSSLNKKMTASFGWILKTSEEYIDTGQLINMLMGTSSVMLQWKVEFKQLVNSRIGIKNQSFTWLRLKWPSLACTLLEFLNLERDYFQEELSISMLTVQLSWSKRVEREHLKDALLSATRSPDRIEILILNAKYLREFTTCMLRWNGNLNHSNGSRKIFHSILIVMHRRPSNFLIIWLTLWINVRP